MNEVPRLPDIKKIEEERAALYQLKCQAIVTQQEYEAACKVFRRSVLLCIHALETHLIETQLKFFPAPETNPNAQA